MARQKTNDKRWYTRETKRFPAGEEKEATRVKSLKAIGEYQTHRGSSSGNMANIGASTSQGGAIPPLQAAAAAMNQIGNVNENVSPNVGAAAEPSVKTSGDKKDWERESAAERLARRTKYMELANDKDPKTVSLQQQAKAMAEPVIEIEDFILYVRTFNLTGATAQQQAVYDKNMAKVKAAVKVITERLDILHVANRHGWEIAKRLIERKQTGEDKELQLAIDDIRKRDADKVKQEKRDRDRRRSRLHYNSPSPKRYRSRSRSRSRSPRRSYSRPHDRSYRDRSPGRKSGYRGREKDKGRCYNCGRSGHYIQDCPKK